MGWFFSIIAAIDRLIRWVVAALLIGLLAIVGLQVVDRHFIDVPIAAPDAYARILVIWLTFLGFALAVRDGLAIRVDLIDHWLSPRLRLWFTVGFDLLILAVLTVLIQKGWLLVVLGQDQSILGTDLTTAVPNAGLWVGAILIFLFVTARLIGLRAGRGQD